jgi:hypothetical protein
MALMEMLVRSIAGRRAVDRVGEQLCQGPEMSQSGRTESGSPAGAGKSSMPSRGSLRAASEALLMGVGVQLEEAGVWHIQIETRFGFFLGRNNHRQTDTSHWR